MRKYCFAGLMALLCFAVQSLQAQDFPNFGKFSREDISMTRCSFDPDAEAVILIREAEANYDDQYRLITWYHVRIKILKESATDEANISIPYYAANSFEYVDNINAFTVNFDENGVRTEHKVEQKSIFDHAVDSKWSERTFSFPAVKVGSILEYEYRSIMKHYGGLDDWKFQSYLPTVYSRYHLAVPPTYEFAYMVNKKDDIVFNVSPHNDRGVIQFEMFGIPGLRNEPYMDARSDYLQRVIFQLSGTASMRHINTSWTELNRDLLSSSQFGTQLNKHLSGTDDFLKLVKAAKSDMAKVKMVYDYVRNNMTWNRYIGVYSVDGVKKAWSKKTGSAADINLILINLLSDANMHVDPVLVSERQHGRVNTTYPFVDQFNSVYACVSLKDRKLYLDATDKMTPFFMTPSAILHTTGFVVNKKGGKLVQIDDDQYLFKQNISIIAQLEPDGQLKGKASINSDGYARTEMLASYRSDKKKFIEERFRKKAGLNLEDYNIQNDNNDSLTLKQGFEFTLPPNKSGQYIFVPTHMFTGFDENPFVAATRFSDIDFGYRQAISLRAYYKYPENMTVDALPKSIKMVNENKTIAITRRVLQDSSTHQVISMIYLDFSASHFSAAEYPAIKEFYKKMFDLLEEPIVLKKKES